MKSQKNNKKGRENMDDETKRWDTSVWEER